MTEKPLFPKCSFVNAIIFFCLHQPQSITHNYISFSFFMVSNRFLLPGKEFPLFLIGGSGEVQLSCIGKEKPQPLYLFKSPWKWMRIIVYTIKRVHGWITLHSIRFTIQSPALNVQLCFIWTCQFVIMSSSKHLCPSDLTHKEFALASLHVFNERGL